MHKKMNIYFEKSLKNMSEEEKKSLVEKCAKNFDDVKVSYISKLDIEKLKNQEKKKSLFVVQNMLSLGNSVLKIKNSMLYLSQESVDILTLDEGYKISSIDYPMILMGMDIFLSVQKQQRSFMMKSSIQQKRAKGERVGRLIGSKNKKPSLCEVYKDYIIQSLAKGISKTEIAKTVGVTSRTIFNFECQNGLR